MKAKAAFYFLILCRQLLSLRYRQKKGVEVKVHRRTQGILRYVTIKDQDESNVSTENWDTKDNDGRAQANSGIKGRTWQCSGIANGDDGNNTVTVTM